MKYTVLLVLLALMACSPSPSDFQRVCLDGVAYWTNGEQMSVSLDRDGKPTPCTYERKLTEKDIVLVDIAEYWVRLLDQGKVKENLNEASAYFRQEITFEIWQQKYESIRAPLGSVLKRKAINLTESMGHKVVVFRTKFVKEDEPLIETVALTKEKGEWRVSGYFIKDEF